MQQQSDMDIAAPAIVQYFCPSDLAVNTTYLGLLTLGSATSHLMTETEHAYVLLYQSTANSHYRLPSSNLLVWQFL